MLGAPPPSSGGYMPTQPPSYAPPQFATFDASNKGGVEGKPVNEDALPPMPSWETARTRKVLEEVQPSHKDHKDHGDDMELGDLNHHHKATGSRARMLDHAAPPAGYDEIGVATPMQSPISNPQGRGRGVGYGRGHDPISPYGEPQGYGGGYRQLGSPNSPRGRAYGGPQRNPGGPYQQDPYSRSPHLVDNQRDDYFGDNARDQTPLRQTDTGGYGGNTQPYAQHDDFQPQLRQNDNVFAGVNARSPPPTHQNGGFSSRSPPPFNQNNDNYGRGDTRNPPLQRQNIGGYSGDAQQPFPKIRSPPPIDLPNILTTGPSSRTPPPARQGTPGADGRSYRAYTPSPASPTHAAYRPPQQQNQHPTWTVV
ncbi:hypothetical protein FGG08_005083 [Glutinoglossum americanum]|uniref:Uncharacterized protein n=1 Tax=Glutinoglossum americanum TaxID=1670608 RepID=A0A9P8I107_9PEZI|nr:hypothetical protein FGG08_005083 [Glutinoglossum americanum]